VLHLDHEQEMQDETLVYSLNFYSIFNKTYYFSSYISSCQKLNALKSRRRIYF